MEHDHEVLRERLTRLSQASLRINESLDYPTVLQGVLDSARSLTGARYGVMTFLDDSGLPRDFLSSGMTAEEDRQLWDLPEGRRLYEYLGGFSAPLRLPDLLGHLRSQGLPELGPVLPVGPALPFLGAPILHQGERAGHLFLAGKEAQQAGEAFSPEDEETLVMFASQAALVIANARRYRDEQRARADLETLVHTSPVGVVVFDARTGAPRSVNREAKRIVEGLRQPDQPPEDLLKDLTFRRGDGREVSLEELSLAQALSAGETVRAEEIVMQGPGGESVTTLVNATPIPSEEGEIDSYVVTLQDLTPLELQERLRAEFLAMVSHELRMPLTSIKGSAATALGHPSVRNAAGTVLPFFRIINQQADHMSRLIDDLLDVARIQTGTLPVHPEPTSVAEVVEQACHSFSGREGADNLRIELPSDLPLVMADPQRIVQVLGNLLSNAARHSPKATPIRLSAVREQVHVAVTVSDRGRGVPAEQLPHLFRKFPRLEAPDQEEGEEGSRLGLAICRGLVEAHGGRIRAASDGEGRGTRITFTLPIGEETGIAAVPTTRRRRRRWGKETRILVVDDDPQTLRKVREALSKAGYLSIVTGDPEQVSSLLEEHRPHLALLDLVLPGADGIELMQELFAKARVPVIFLSAHDQDEGIARAFDAGAADYVVKPFSPTELTARVRAALRRRAAPGRDQPTEPSVVGELTVDYGRRRATLAGRRVPLTDTEYRLLVELAIDLGTPVAYQDLLQQVWGLPPSADRRTLRSTVKSIRRKLGDEARKPTYIFNESKVGYRLGGAEDGA